MIATKESKTKNYKENILTNFEAVTHVVNLLFRTPRAFLPYSLGMGFELRDLLFKDPSSSEYDRSLNDLKSQIRLATGNSDMTVAVDRDKDSDGSTVTEIILTVNVSGTQSLNVYVPIDNGEPKYKDIIVK